MTDLQIRFSEIQNLADEIAHLGQRTPLLSKKAVHVSAFKLGDRWLAVLAVLANLFHTRRHSNQVIRTRI
jgi:hypothetical protein